MQTVLVAKALIVDEDGYCLVLHRSKTHPKSALKPDLPGGRIEEGESPLAALLREVKEEVGFDLSAENTQLLFSSTDVYDDKNFVRLLFVSQIAGNRPAAAISWEHDSAEWQQLAEIAQYIEHPVYKRGIRHIIDNKLMKP